MSYGGGHGHHMGAQGGYHSGAPNMQMQLPHNGGYAHETYRGRHNYAMTPSAAVANTMSVNQSFPTQRTQYPLQANAQKVPRCLLPSTS